MCIFNWINEHLQPTRCDSPELIYDDMASQSGRCLPILYQPFDARNRTHWCDRGCILDFLEATRAEGKSVLDFGPGDGWPALLLAPFVECVVGVDASVRRIGECKRNAEKLGIGNATFVHVPPGEPLPFDDGSFDAVTAASSVEQTPDPKAALAELLRVLRPGGRLRMAYESLTQYRGCEHDLWLHPIDEARCKLLLYDRRIDAQRVHHVALSLALSAGQLTRALTDRDEKLTIAHVTPERLAACRNHITETVTCALTHPSTATWCEWLRELGARDTAATESGGDAAGVVFDRASEGAQPRGVADVDRLLRPTVAEAVRRTAIDACRITAVK
ncbi:MAG: class I SAM-dependent methyltransferase [Phycisphaerales bacterium]|nr:class I SAM-dependent methyltransferase [Phycisphaerales bacterium]